MKQYKHLKQEENDFHIKQSIGIAGVLISVFVCVCFVLIFLTDYVKTGWIILIVLVVFFVLSQTTHKGSKKIVIRNGIPEHMEFRFAKFREPIVYQIEDIRTITIRRIYYGQIPLSIILLGEVEVNGKLKTIVISQSMNIKMIQELYNELDDLLKIN